MPVYMQQPRPGRADQRDQVLEAVIAVGDAELGGGDAELAVVRGNADIGEHRDLHAAAETEAADAGDRRFRVVGEQRALGFAASGIFFGGFGVVAGFFELADVGARDERLVAGTDQDHDAHVAYRRAVRPAPHPVPPTSPATSRCACAGLLKVMTPTPSVTVCEDLAVGVGSFRVVLGTSSMARFR